MVMSDVVMSEIQNAKPGLGPGLREKYKNAESYPVGVFDSGRRARDVMPAAMRALVTISAAMCTRFMARTLPEVCVRRN
jgi:hypothetical protein